MSNVVKFIDATRPETITVSEARVSAMRSKASNFSRFMAALRKMGYTVEERGVYDSDLEVIRGISVCKEFYRRVSRPLMVDHMESMMAGELEDFEREERSAARDFFRSKGYGS